MKNSLMIVFSLALSASTAMASDHLTQIANHARDLASDYRKMNETLKNKNFATADLQQELRDADSDLEKIKALLAEHAASNPEFTTAQQKDWKMAQDLVALIGVFQDRKTELLSDDNPQKKRKTIQAEAQALVTRAVMLEKAALRLAQGSATASGS